MLDANQTVTDTYTGEAFGNLMGMTSNIPNLAKPDPWSGRGRCAAFKEADDG